MKSIIKEDKLPKFIVVNGESEKTSWNKHLLKPLMKGEIVRVSPYSEQIPDNKYDGSLKYAKPYTVKRFKEKFVKVIRKDDKGKWTLPYILGWENVDLLIKK